MKLTARLLFLFMIYSATLSAEPMGIYIFLPDTDVGPCERIVISRNITGTNQWIKGKITTYPNCYALLFYDIPTEREDGTPLQLAEIKGWRITKEDGSLEAEIYNNTKRTYLVTSPGCYGVQTMVYTGRDSAIRAVCTND